MTYLEYKKFKTVGEWWEKEGQGKFPLQLPMAISKLQKEQGLTFHEAFEHLVNIKAVIFIDKKENKQNNSQSVDISKIKVEFGGDKAPKDEKAIELFKRAYSGDLMCYVALIQIQGIKPFSDFKPKTPEDFTKLLEKRLQEKNPIPIYVYQEDHMFVMSDDYNAYYYYLEKGLDKLLCFTLGEPTGSFVVEKSEPFKLPPLTAETLEE